MQTIQLLEGSLAIQATLRNISKPLFQDYTPAGRLIGVLLRLSRILLGIFLYGLVFCFYLFFYLIWIFFPIFCLVSLVGGLLGPAHNPL